MYDVPNRIKLEDCEHRKLYRLVARNLAIGVFNKDTQEFIGIRTKFGSRFLDHEFHWDAPRFATCNPMEILGELPTEIDVIIYYPGMECRYCKVPTEYRKFDEPREVTMNGHTFMAHGQGEHLAPTDCDKADPVLINNEKLFYWLKEQEKIHVPG